MARRGGIGDTEAGLNHWGDIVTLVGYFILTLSVCLWSICKQSKKSVRGYFLAGQSASWWAAGLSLFASNVSSEHFIGFAGTGAASGIAIALFEWNAILLILLLAWVFLPVYMISGVYTLPEYLKRRFGRERLRILMAIIFLVSTVLVPADLYSGGIFVQQALGWNIYAGVLLIVSISGIYTVFGGLATVMYTDAIQVVIMLGGAVVVTIIGLQKVGGFSELRTKYMNAIPDTLLYYQGNMTLHSNQTNGDDRLLSNASFKCGFPREDAWSLFRHPIHSDLPSVAVMLRMTVVGLFYWCAHQTIVQRVLATKDVSHAKGAALLAGLLKISPFFLMVIPGMVSRTLFPNEVACVDPSVCLSVCGSPAGCSNIAYPKLVLTILPTGLRGLMLAVMLSAVISSLTSIYNSVATVVTFDLWVKFRPAAKAWELLLIGRISVVLVIAISVGWIPIMQDADGGQMLKYITAVVGYLGAPLSAVFIMAMFWCRSTEQGAFYGLLVSFACGLGRFVLDTIYGKPVCGGVDTRPAVVSRIHPYYFTVIQVAVGVIVCTVISLFTKPRTKEELYGLTFWTRNIPLPTKNGCGQDDDEQNESLRKEETKNKYDDNISDNVDIEMNEVRNTTKVETDAELEFDDLDKTVTMKQRLLEAICGSKGLKSDRNNGSEREDLAKRMRKLEIPTKRNLVLNILAVFLICILLTLYIIFR